MTNKELFDECLKESKELLQPHILHAYPGDDDLLIHLAFILFKHKLKQNEPKGKRKIHG